FAYSGDDPDGYLTAPEVVRFLRDYAVASAAPVRSGVTVTSVRPGGRGYLVSTDRGTWNAATVVIATGAAAVPVVPAMPVPTGITTVTAADYCNPGLLPPGGVLVVGASASGVQIADELRRSGRPVTLAVGEHVRMPRTYRGRDILWWLDAAGVLDERYEAQPDLVRARSLPSMQLVGSPQRATVDLTALQRRGVRLVGRFVGVRDDLAQFSGALHNVCALADLKLGRLLDTLDAWADQAGIDAEAPQRFAPTELPATADLSARVGEGGIETIVWATGYRADLSFVDAGVLDRKGRPVHDGGVTASPGLYLVGLPFLRRRKSTLIDGAASDARELVAHLVAHLDTLARRRAS
ncbi:MAG TPA: NAD(P)-binding domain-containing protein, partial [Pseudonocardia sp.]|nr:NAD(P)-binding domain-containing protein [Pseudonocardia sp.]